MITHKGKLVRISPRNPRRLEESRSGGRAWTLVTERPFTFIDITDCGNEILAQTSAGLYASTSGGRTWTLRHR
ncbi:MAG: hypothetical protein ACI4QA_00205 [Candidatus Spyradosoma sp.]